MTSNFELLPGSLAWINEPDGSEVIASDSLSITAGAETDWFFDPAGAVHKHDAPVALFTPSDETFLLSARVTVDFASTFDAGVLMIYADEQHWAKLCFEYTPSQEPMIVSVVTRGTSDDCNSTIIEGNSVYLRVYRQADTLAFHYAVDGHYWHLVRYFSIGDLQQVRAGFSAQSPTGAGCRVQFSEIGYRAAQLTDLRNGA